MPPVVGGEELTRVPHRIKSLVKESIEFQELNKASEMEGKRGKEEDQCTAQHHIYSPALPVAPYRSSHLYINPSRN